MDILFTKFIVLFFITNGALVALLIVIFYRKNVNQFIFFLCIFFLQTLAIAQYFGFNNIYSQSINVFLLACIGPFLFYYFQKILNPKLYLNKIFYYHILLPIILGSINLAFSQLSMIGKNVIYTVAVGSNLFYIISLELNLIRYWRSNFSKEVTILTSLIVLDISIFLTLRVIDQWVAYDLLQWSHLLVSAIVILIFILNIRFPIFLEKINTNTKYRKSKLNNINFEELNHSFKILFEDKKIFLDENISLKKVANAMELSLHQVSEFINNEKHMSFFNLINQYRVREAQSLLIKEPTTNILNIAFTVGFNNKSSFNAAFQKFTGQTPNKFRNKHK